jgi:lipopolysaccharide transport protein LptA
MKHSQAILVLLFLLGNCCSFANDASLTGEVKQDFTRITSDGSLTIDYARHIAKFKKNVLLKDAGGTLRSDRLTVYFDNQGEAIKQMIARGNVVIDQGEHYSESGRADYDGAEHKLVLKGDPIIRKGSNFYAAEVITIFLTTNKVLFEPSARIVVKREGKSGGVLSP